MIYLNNLLRIFLNRKPTSQNTKIYQNKEMIDLHIFPLYLLLMYIIYVQDILE